MDAFSISRFLRAACVFLSLVGLSPAHATTIFLDSTNVADFSNSAVDNGDQSAAGGFSVTFSNVQATNGTSGAANVQENGIFMSDSTFFRDLLSAEVVFNVDTVIDEYVIGASTVSAGGFQLSGANGTSGINSAFNVGQFAFDMGSIPYFVAGASYLLTHTISAGNNFAQLDALIVSRASPAPILGTLPLLMTGLWLAGIGFARKKKQI